MSQTLLDSIVKLLDGSNKTSQEKYEELRYYFRNKGFGDRESELTFFKEFFSHFFQTQFQIFQVEWIQYQDYNDNWYFFDLHDIKVNQYLSLLHSGFDDTAEEAWKYRFDQSDSESERNKEFFARLEKKYHELRPHIDKVLIFLKALYDQYGGYYFIYVFGTRAAVAISADGIAIDNEPPY